MTSCDGETLVPLAMHAAWTIYHKTLGVASALVEGARGLDPTPTFNRVVSRGSAGLSLTGGGGCARLV